MLNQRSARSSRGSLHGLILVTTRSRGKVSDIDVVILLELLQAGHDPLLDQVLAPGRRGDGFTRLLHLNQGLVGGQTAQRINQNSVRLGNIETDVGDLVGHKSIQNGEKGAVDNVECDNGGEGLRRLAR